MLFLISPAKSLNETKIYPACMQQAKFSQPALLAQAATVAQQLKQLPAAEIAKLMKLSDKLAQVNQQRFASWHKSNPIENSYPAISLFNGDVYEGIDITNLATNQLDWLNQHLLILSGLYGLIKPLDLIQPYRLEMGTKIAIANNVNLYDFWQDTITQHLNSLIKQHKYQILVNLASQEYSKAINFNQLSIPIIECVFEDYKNQQFKIISFYAKRARGLMARFASETKAKTIADLQKFNLEGYQFIAANSTANKLVFRRKLAN